MADELEVRCSLVVPLAVREEVLEAANTPVDCDRPPVT